MKNKNLNPEDLKKYASGKLSNKDANRVERTLLDQPLYADAVEGFEALETDKIDINSVNIDLKNRLRERVQTSTITHTPTRIIPLWQKASIAASVILLIGFGIYLFNKNIDNQVVTINKPAKKQEFEVRLDSSIFETNKKEDVGINKSKNRDNSFSKNEDYEVTPIRPINDSLIAIPEIKDEDLTLSETPPPVAQAEKPKYTEVRTRGEEKYSKELESKDEATPIISSEAGRMGISTISGTVVNEEKEPISGVAIHLKGTTKTAKTDEKGQFFIDGLRKGNILVLNYNDIPTQEFVVSSPLVGQIVYSENSGHNLEAKVNKKADPFSSNDYIDTRPENGWTMFQDYVKENLKMPLQASEKGIKGKVSVKFRVSEDGQLSDFRITKSLGFGCDEEAIRLISEGPKWFPASRFGKKVSTTTTVTIKFE